MIAFLRSFRIGPFAIFDFAVSYLVVFLIAPYLSKFFRLFGIEVSRMQWLLLTLPIAVLTHLALGTDTPLTKMILDPSGHYLAKIIVIAMLLAGLFFRS